MVTENNAEEPESLRRMLTQATDLQLFPVAAERVRAVASRTDSSLADLEKAVSMDPALSAQILKIANSPFFKMPRAVADIKQALLLLGFQATRDLALALAVMTLTKTGRDDDHGLWEHAVGVGTSARLLGEHIDGVDGRELFVAGLLHDLGKLILLHLDPENYRALLAASQGSAEQLLACEQTNYDFDHAQLGGACLKQWDLPERVCSAVLLHHDPGGIKDQQDSATGRAATAVWIANKLLQPDPAQQAAPLTLSEHPLCQELGFTPKLLQDIVDESLKEAQTLQLG